MPHLLLFLALLLIGAGGGALYMAIDLAGIERGTMYAVSGAVAVSAGVVTLALARILATLERLAQAAATWPSAQATDAERVGAVAPPHLAIPAIDAKKIEAAARAAEPPVAEAPNPAAREAAKPPATALGETGSRTGKGKDEPGATQLATPVIAAKTPEAATRAAPEAGLPKPAAVATGVAAATLSAASLAKDVKEETLDWLDKSLAGVGEGDGQPRVVGRYQASGVDYVMYSDGSIEADNGGARRRFASLAELKAFIGAA